ncbi:MAG TPA: amylo-alpha-1,6-glucosidase [Rubricoccaceae bacterium]
MPLSARLLARALGLALCAVGAAGCTGDAPDTRLAQSGPPALAALGVEALSPAAGDSLLEARTTFQTDGAGAAWLDGLAGPARTPAAGLTAQGERVLDAWEWYVDADSAVLGPESRTRGVARPDFAVRSYAQPDTGGVLSRVLATIQRASRPHLTERVTLLDGRGALLVEVADSVGTVGFRPLASDHRTADGYQVRRTGGALVFARTDRAADTTGAPVWTAVVADRGAARGAAAVETAPVTADAKPVFALGEVALPTPGRLVVATGRTPALAARAAREALGQADALRERRSARMAALLDAAPFTTADERTNTALRWALLSLDALVVRADSGRAVLLPGLPGAEPASFGSTMETVGAFLDAGQWQTARQLLLTTASEQLFDQRIASLGRAPDLVRPDGEAVFSTAEATPLFLRAAGEVVRTTGERGIVSGGPNFWFKTVFALRGVYEKDRRNGAQTDTLGFLTTRDGRGTALDGDPAVRGVVRRAAPAEAQGALVGALQTAAEFSRIMGVSQRSTARWYADTSVVLVRRFEGAYGRGPLLADRLDTQQRALPDVRPGGLVALARMRGAMPDARRAALARPLAERLVFPYGVASLAQSDSLFHPFVDSGGLYPEAAARTEGAVWTALAGPVITLMAQTGGATPAAELFTSQVALLLDRGAVGAVPELVDGHPRDEDAEPGVGGAPVNPWSLAGLLTAAYEGFAGVRYQSPDTLVVEPHLPEAWGTTVVQMRMGAGAVTLHLTPTEGGLDASVVPRGDVPAGAAVRLRAGGADVVLALAETRDDTLVVVRDSFAVALAGGRATVGGTAVEARPFPAAPDAWDGFAFATPDLRDEYPVMRARASQRSLTAAQVGRDNPAARVALTQTDPDGDDWGSTSTFTYPEGVPPGALDVTYLEVAQDDSTTYVRAEFTALPAGEPRTAVAVVFDTGEGGETEVGRNARYRFPEAEAYDVVVFIGESLVIEDGNGRELGRLDAASVFDPRDGRLAFALPTSVLPRLGGGTKVTVLVGALDGDGGFRDVRRGEAGDDGGGRVDASAPNVYDVVVGSTR